jgi:hypothetical protein
VGRKLFGIDIAREVYDGIRSAGNVVAMSLVRVTPGTRTTGALTAGTNPSSTTYSCRGFKTSRRRKDPGSTTSDLVSVVAILGASLPSGVEPRPNDKVVFEGATYIVNRVRTDPADALWECEVG